MAFYRLNEKHNGVEIVFNEKPNADTLEALKMGGFRWHRGGGYWYAVQSPERLELAEKIASRTEEAETETAEKYYTIASPGYMGATETTGSVYANGGCYYGSDLSKAIREALKKCKIGGCSVRCKTFSGGQEIAVTVKIGANDIISFAEFYENNKHNYSNIYWYTDTDGKSIHRDAMPWSDYDKAQEIIKNTLELYYNRIIKDMGGEFGGYNYHGGDGILKKAAADKVAAIQRILNAFNHDDSNGMVDYFDRHFYEDIYIKFAA